MRGSVRPYERQMVAEVGDRLGEVHAAEAETDTYALVQGGEHALAQPRCQGGLAEQDPAKGDAESSSAFERRRTSSSCSGESKCASSISKMTRWWRSCSSAPSRAAAWFMASALWKRGVAPKAVAMAT
jgi:hypothetical protein